MMIKLMCCCSTQKTTKTLVCACVCVWVSQMYLCVSVYVYVGDCKMRMYPTVFPFFSLLSFPQARCINLFMLVFTWTAPICRLTKYKLLFTPCLTYSFFTLRTCACVCVFVWAYSFPLSLFSRATPLSLHVHWFDARFIRHSIQQVSAWISFRKVL